MMAIPVVAAVLPALLAIIVGSPRLRGFFALQLPPLSVWAAIVLILAMAAASLLIAARTARTDMPHGEER